MQKLFVNEVFCSIQGEGARSGTLNIFIRLTGCDLACGYCDTEFTSGKELELETLLKLIKQHNCKNIIWTGGEPSIQLSEEAVEFFSEENYYQAIETNGNHKVPAGIDYVAVSPKVAEHVLVKNFTVVNELRYPRHKGHLSLPDTSLTAEHYYISPVFNGNQINYENLAHCIKLLEGQEKWKLSIQLHKLLQIL